MTEPYPKYILRNILISGTSVVGGGNVPIGGTTGQYLRKLSATDFDTGWSTLTVANITDLTATAVELGYVSGVTSAIQTQLNSKLGTTLSSANILVGNGLNVATAVAVTGDVTIDNTGVTAIGTGVIVNADINATAAIAQSKMAALTASRAMVTDASGFATVSTVTSTEVGHLSGVTSAIQTQLNGKLTSTLTSAQVFVGNGLNVATGVAISGDITITNAGVVGIAAGVIVNADISGTAAIALSKLATVTASRALASDASGFVSASAVTSTELGYLSGVNAAIQTQLDNEIGTKTVNAIIKSPTIAEDGYAITWDNTAGEYTLTDPIIQGLTAGGTAGQFLYKLSGTNYDAAWRLLVQTDISDVTSTAAELNILDGATLTTAELNYVDGVTSAIQTQLDGKQSSSLPQGSVWVGNGSGIASAVAPGTSGYLFTMVGSTPSWQPPSTQFWTSSSGTTLTGANLITMAGNNVTFESGATPSRLIFSADNNVARIFSFRTANVQRWAFRVDDNETGANAGANFYIRRYNDAGTFIDAPISIARSTGLPSLPNGLIVGGASITAGSVLADFQSTTLGVVFPRVTNIASVATPVNGMMVYDAATNLFNLRQNGAWLNPIGGSLTSGQLAYSTGASTIASSANLLWDNTKARFEVNGQARSSGAISFVSLSSSDSREFVIDWLTSSVSNSGVATLGWEIFTDDLATELQDKSALVEYNVLLTKSDGSDNQIKKILVGYRKDGLANCVQTGAALEVFSVGNATPTVTFSISAGGLPEININDNTSGGWKVKVWAKVSRSN